MARVGAPSQWAKATLSSQEGVKFAISLCPPFPSVPPLFTRTPPHPTGPHLNFPALPPNLPAPPLFPPRLLSTQPRKLNHANSIKQPGAGDGGIVSAPRWSNSRWFQGQRRGRWPEITLGFLCPFSQKITVHQTATSTGQNNVRVETCRWRDNYANSIRPAWVQGIIDRERR